MYCQRVITLILITVVCFSCGKKESKVPYEFLVFRDDNIKMWTDTIPLDMKDLMEGGDYEVNDKESGVIAKGKFSNGFRIGQWTYHPSDNQTVRIDWSKYSNDTSRTIVNYPREWTVHEIATRPFQATFPTHSKIKKDKFFIVFPQPKDSIGMDLKRYWRHYNVVAFEDEEVKEYALFEFETSSGKSYYFSRYILKRNNEEMLILNFLGEKGATIYDVTYSTLNEDYEEKHIIFFDMVRTMVLQGERFFSPFDPVKRFRSLQKPKKLEEPKPSVS